MPTALPLEVDSGNDGFTGTQSTTLPMRHYALDISVTRGIAEQWLPLVKSVDVLATDEATLLSAGHAGLPLPDAHDGPQRICARDGTVAAWCQRHLSAVGRIALALGGYCPR